MSAALPGGAGYLARALEQVGAVDPRGADADQDLAVAGNRIGPFLDLERDHRRMTAARMSRSCYDR